ncbi:bifunctional UDP-N-acetylglucosamine diphosphorylase/glucosamine-1-phosphate N-acetyltransferase GlmU [Campylobacter porcelli]|uniref:bifunctional UDP-N-acetylglucosamine diphosphorylase/glucosamine-1-phosphate N-acetyltransferase GlmU n=1 Tax=Campylobacter porcelli TaxID=1660073 RepID=UPI000A334946|nr:bifunctional UDP-N-acetylglucosamine diphosphorylase/glucosamine-1-phosphate N-acetyltransferase GlmU [Campylobacter sp. P0078]
MKNISIIILAAGNGTRMKSPKSKVLHTLSGRSMISHIIEKSLQISDDISVVLGYQFDEVSQAINSEFSSINIARQDIKSYPGTAGAVMAARPKFDKTLIICADMPLVKVEELRSIAQANSDITIATFESKDPFGYGRVIKDGNQVVKIVEQKDATPAQKDINLCNAGAYCFNTDLLKSILPQINNQNASNEYYLTDAIEIAIKDGKSVGSVLVDEQNFMGINDKLALSKAEILMQNEIKSNLMKNGIIIRLPDSVFIDSRAKFEGECEIESGCVIKGDCLIKNSIIKSGSVVEYSTIIDSDIGPMAHLRPKSYIKSTHIGNFVELKNANLDGVKAGHLSYLGDCQINEGTNVGCGTITCNYDGKSKNKTIIGKNVFIGSDTQLIAPLNIADDTIIAAGSSVTKDSQKGDLIIARAKQSNKSGFFYKFFGIKDEK